MKRIITLLLVAVMALSMVACAGSNDTNPTTAPATTTAPTETTAPTDATVDNGNGPLPTNDNGDLSRNRRMPSGR